MKNVIFFRRAQLFLMVFILFKSICYSQELPSKKNVLDEMLLANKYFMDKWPDPTTKIFVGVSHPSNIWGRSTYYEGLMSLYYITRDTSYYKYAVDWASYHKWNVTYGDSTTRIADSQCCGQTYIELYLLDKKPERIRAITYCIDRMVNSTKTNDWYWIDAMHMAMPVFAKLGTIYNDNKYFEKMYDLYFDTKTKIKNTGLYNTTDHLWWRDSSYLPPKTTPNGKQIYWSRGNGWVIAALARVLDVMPENAPYRSEYIQTFKEMASSIITLQRSDGFWNPSLVDPLDYGGKETSGTAFYTFGLAWGINKGVLDSQTYLLPVVKAWNGLINEALHSNGMLGYVQGGGQQPSDGQPISYDKPADYEDFALGAFLLAGSEIYKLAKDSSNSIKIYKTDKGINLKISPNPSHDNVNITFYIENHSKISMDIYDLNGSKVKSLIKDKCYSHGNYVITWNLNNSQSKKLASGLYFLYFLTDSYKKVIKFEIIQ